MQISISHVLFRWRPAKRQLQQPSISTDVVQLLVHLPKLRRPYQIFGLHARRVYLVPPGRFPACFVTVALPGYSRMAKGFSVFSAVKLSFLQLIGLNTITTGIAARACVDFPQLAIASRDCSKSATLSIIANFSTFVSPEFHKLFVPGCRLCVPEWTIFE